MKKRMLSMAVIGILLASSLLAGCAGGDKSKETAKPYPTKQVELVVAFAPGGATDLAARAAADYLTKEWGQPISVVNKTGGGGAVGALAALKQSGADGYTALADTVSMTTLINAGSTNPPVKLADRKLVVQLVTDNLIFMVKEDAPWKDMKDFSEWAKKNPDQLTWGSTGPTGLAAFAIAEWMQVIGADFKKSRLVPSQGAADSVPKVAGGHYVLTVQGVGESMNLIKAGKIKVLGIAAAKRSPFLPNVPTLEEQGIKGVTTTYFMGISMPVSTPDPVIKKWEDACAKMVKDPAFLQKMNKLYLEVGFKNSVDFSKAVTDQTVRFTELATKLGMRK
ncbi:MAG: tripartite tricarboxylate transporter substrate binding protein [Negativicutes bacterium]